MKVLYIIFGTAITLTMIFGNHSEVVKCALVGSLCGVAAMYAILESIESGNQKILGRIEQLDEATLRIENDIADLSYGGRGKRLKAELGEPYLPNDDRAEGLNG
jgi:hypothetical protein